MRRMARYLTAAALVLAACGRDTGGMPTGPNEIGGRVTTTVAPDGPGQSSPAPPATDNAGRPRPTTRPSSGGSTRTTTPGGSANDPVPALAQRAPGAMAGVILQSQPATKLVLDVLRQPGADPSSATIDRLAARLEEVSGKPVRVSNTPIPTSGEVHSAEEIRDNADRFTTTPQGRGTAVLRVLYLKGSFAQNDSTLGVAVRGDTFAVFPEQIQGASSPFASAALVERAVVTHELGHLLGLVDLYLDRGRDDGEHPGHSPNTRSVMFWAVESDLVTTVLGGPPPVDFDDDDLADLAAIRGGAPPNN